MIKYHFIISLLVKLFDLRKNEWCLFTVAALRFTLTFFFYFSAHTFGFLAGSRAMFAEARCAVYISVAVLETEDRFVGVVEALGIDQATGHCEVVYLVLGVAHQVVLPMADISL